MATTSIYLSLSPFVSKFRPQHHNSLSTHISPCQLTSPLSFSTLKRNIYFHHPIHRNPHKSNQIWTTSATNEDVLPSDSTSLELTQQIVTSTGDDGTSRIISVLLFMAFLALSILTIGVIYIAVADFLQKRERDKFEKEEAAKKKSKKKGKVRDRTGPRGFGQKSEEFEDE
ncbi:hypothetical protein CFOL_v3_21762 [Cephalotus follicularis]|uniref:Transmembrane protein n=1 Tax=Cephalotus follicularis TaxID=3775 RepID=A0A1Q3CDI2_CEPFO|nr:hypothetical protein CFOL_v3_21762 [Cephalotus follicularis]